MSAYLFYTMKWNYKLEIWVKKNCFVKILLLYISELDLILQGILIVIFIPQRINALLMYFNKSEF